MRETGMRYRIQDMVYQFPEMGVLYIRMIVVDDDDVPIRFLVCTPHDVLCRETEYDQEIMDKMIEESDAAMQQYQNQVDAEKLKLNEETLPDHATFYG